MSRLEWILGILLVVLLLVVIGISAFIWLQPRAPEVADVPTAVSAPIGPAATPIYAGKTARVGFAAAQQALTGWQTDAVLLDATATWPTGATEADVRAGSATWGYTFYSPGTARVALITVLGDKAQLVSESEYQAPTTPASIGAWVIDSEQAVDIFLNAGGAAFMRDNGVTTLIMQLTTSSADGRVIWLASLFGEENGRSFTMRIDATSGDVIETVEA
ncbi:MAG: hypothetical protein KC425_04870 [Anaerolineales bacterium]|nr:hypothetical protein [Anaerolineales bacterium]